MERGTSIPNEIIVSDEIWGDLINSINNEFYVSVIHDLQILLFSIFLG